MDILNYLTNFNVIDKTGLEYELSKLLYKAILNKFKIQLTTDEYGVFKKYHENVFDLVEDLREINYNLLIKVFEYLDKSNPYLIDIIIMCWCLPRTDNFLSKQQYNKNYISNISNYHHKMIKHIQCEQVKNFCVETITKINYVPIHCIDYIWFYLGNMSLNLKFSNSINGTYIGFISDLNEDGYIDFIFNMEFLLEFELGNISYPGDPFKKGCFRDLLYSLLENENIINQLMKNSSNFKSQFLKIGTNLDKYFSNDRINLSENIIKNFKTITS